MSARSEASPTAGARVPASDETTARSGGSGGAVTNPFPGPRPFTETDNSLFFGRDRELSDLVALLFAQRAVLLHAPSGAGKSSLVSAGLIPRARQRGFEFLPVARVRGTGLSTDSVAGNGVVSNRYVANVIDNWRAAGQVVPSQAVTLSEVLNGLPSAGEPGRVVVFDQIEELFVLHPDRWNDRAELFTQVQTALDHDPLLHFLFVLRDDYLAWLEPLTPRLRDRLSTRYHLGGLSSPQALNAVVRPFAVTGRVFAPGVAEALVTALREQPADPTDPAALAANRSYESETVEPVQLQIVCRTFFERLPSEVTEISADDVARHADVQQALVGFYEQAVTAAVKSRAGVHERRLRLWFERQLITPARTRGIVFQGERTTAGLPNSVVDELERRRIVRSEPRGPALWYELTHDRLIDAVLGSNRVWYAKRSRTVTRRAAVAVTVFALLAAAVSFVAFHGRSSSLATSGATQPKKSQIAVAGQTVDFPVRGRAGQLLTAVMTPDPGFAGELRLFDARGLPVGEPSAAESSQPLLTSTLPADGDYRIRAGGLGSSTGPFSLTLVVQSVGVRAELAAADPTPGSITAPNAVDVYTFQGQARAVAKITVLGDLDSPELVLVGPGGQGFFPVSGAENVVVTTVLPKDGRYELHAFSLSNKTGAYRIQLQFLAGASLEPGKVAGSISDQVPTDVRTVRSGAGGVLFVAYDRRQPVHDVSLVAADGRTLRADYGSGGFTLVIAPATTYLLVVSAAGLAGPASYSLVVAIQQPLALSAGRAQGELGRAGQLAVYRQDSEQGDVATILVTPVGQFDPAVQIVQPDGTTLIERDTFGPGQAELFTVPIQETGPQLIVISSSNSGHETGGFSLAITLSKAPAPAP